MKRILWLAMIALLLTAAAGAEEPLTFADITAKDKFVIETEYLASYLSEVGTELEWYRQMQGSCTDGTYAYLMVRNGKIDKNSVWKIDLSDMSVVDRFYDAPINHGNDAAYNPNTGKVIIVNGEPRYDLLSIMNPETLEIEATVKPGGSGIYCIAYHPTRDQYVLGHSSGIFRIKGPNFEGISIHNGPQSPGWITQGCDCDDHFIYFPQWDSATMRNYLIVYDWAGKYVNTIEILTDRELEVESLFHVGSEVYIAFNTQGAHLYKASLKKVNE